jgi:hypothetical protein
MDGQFVQAMIFRAVNMSAINDFRRRGKRPVFVQE